MVDELTRIVFWSLFQTRPKAATLTWWSGFSAAMILRATLAGASFHKVQPCQEGQRGAARPRTTSNRATRRFGADNDDAKMNESLPNAPPSDTNSYWRLPPAVITADNDDAKMNESLPNAPPSDTNSYWNEIATSLHSVGNLACGTALPGALKH
ncbi:hypothetical protein T265_09222 [Opisthorchis viverrini]|uniref:Uncharacterized protein n=1 Tax=Opisthorchis viverrini TaxID=6198 RepID=A0A074Z6P8_OPIVI|nr:hypothetical protein T265_09222 [Opisthorchis viverrini]KER22738.1 hypothetical protein T265_09222 [Opisthorchis viverrini]